MSSVDRDTNVLDEKKLLTTEKVTTSDEVHKRNEKIITIEEVFKGTNFATNEEVDKGTEKLEYMK